MRAEQASAAPSTSATLVRRPAKMNSDRHGRKVMPKEGADGVLVTDCAPYLPRSFLRFRLGTEA